MSDNQQSPGQEPDQTPPSGATPPPTPIPAQVQVGAVSVSGEENFVKGVFTGVFGFFKKLKWLLLLLLFSILCLLLYLYSEGVFDEFLDSKEYQVTQKQKLFEEKYPLIQGILKRFDEYSGYDPLSEYSEKRVRPKNLKDIETDLNRAISMFESNPPNDFPVQLKIWYHQHKALMYLVKGALSEDKRSILNAKYEITLAKDAQLVWMNSSKIDANFESDVLEDIQKDEIMILVFTYILDGDMDSLSLAKSLLTKLGGCDYLLEQSVKNLRVFKPLGCSVPNYG